MVTHVPPPKLETNDDDSLIHADVIFHLRLDSSLNDKIIGMQ